MGRGWGHALEFEGLEDALDLVDLRTVDCRQLYHDASLAAGAARADALVLDRARVVQAPLDRLEDRRLADAVRADDADRRFLGDREDVLAAVLLVVLQRQPGDDHAPPDFDLRASPRATSRRDVRGCTRV